jgi:hypothetical protein
MMGRAIVKEEGAWNISFLFEMMWSKGLTDPPHEDCLVKSCISLICVGEREIVTQAERLWFLGFANHGARGIL